MKKVLEAAKVVVFEARDEIGRVVVEAQGDCVVPKACLDALVDAIAQYEAQVLRFGQTQYIKILQSASMSAKSREGRKTEILIEAGDKVRFIGHDNKFNNVLIETTDVSRLQFKLPACQEHRTWEWTNA